MDAQPFSREELLSQTAWLHSLARHLAMQPSDADDAAQQTWVQALRAVPRGVRSWRPFLATTLRNIVALTNRAERRRTARQLAAGADGGGCAESTADLVARIELHRHLASLVLELPDAQRELVLRHYFVGDTIAELARRGGMTAAAVRGHLHRARGCLRQRLSSGRAAPASVRRPRRCIHPFRDHSWSRCRHEDEVSRDRRRPRRWRVRVVATDACG
jgi:RNA polymerase sigma-70 factor (ECF subfamily)